MRKVLMCLMCSHQINFRVYSECVEWDCACECNGDVVEVKV